MKLRLPKMKLKLSQQIGLTAGLTILFVTLILGYFSLTYSSKMLLDAEEESIVSIAKSGANQIEAVNNMRLGILLETASKDFVSTMNWMLQQRTLVNDMERLGYLDMAVVTLNGSATYVLSEESEELGDMDFIQKALAGESNVSDIVISNENTPALLYTVPIINNERIRGALIGRKDGNSLKEITDELVSDENGYAFIIGSDATFFAHPNAENVINQVNLFEQIDIDGPYKDLGYKLKELGIGNSGIIKYDYEGEKHIVALEPIKGTSWVIGVSVNENAVLKQVNNLKLFIYILTLVIVLIGITVGAGAGIMTAKPIAILQSTLEAISRYDLTEDLNQKHSKIISRSDEIGSIARSISTMKDNILKLVQAIAINAEHIASSSEELTSITEQTTYSANEVSRTIEEIAKGASDQAKQTEHGAMATGALGELIAENLKNVEELNLSINHVNSLSDTGLETVHDLGEKNDETGSAAKEIHGIILEAKNSADSIKVASEMIKSIADQTNLLALNASIEAARAGDAGKGFAVVAEEIRKLAEQSNRFANEISDIIAELTANTEASVNVIEKVNKIMDSQTVSVNNTIDKFNGIREAIDKIRIMIENLNTSGNNMDAKKDDMIGIMENLSAIAQQNAAGTQEVSASVELQTNSIAEIAHASESLAELAQELQTEISKFKY